jgi:hypothetical protein
MLFHVTHRRLAAVSNMRSPRYPEKLVWFGPIKVTWNSMTRS